MSSSPFLSRASTGSSCETGRSMTDVRRGDEETVAAPCFVVCAISPTANVADRAQGSVFTKRNRSVLIQRQSTHRAACDEPFQAPNRPPAPPRQAQPDERLFELVRGPDRLLGGLRDHGPHGIEAQFFQNEEFHDGRRFDTRARGPVGRLRAERHRARRVIESCPVQRTVNPSVGGDATAVPGG
jgi:hypothetical protein